jgi:hypothetical protein
VLMLMSVTSGARAQEPSSAAGMAAPVEQASPDNSTEERAFTAELERFARKRAFTQHLMAKREAEAFEQALDRQARVAKLQRELAEREAALLERELDAAVQLYLRKRELTRLLSTAATRPLPR